MQKLTLEGTISISDTSSILNHMNITITDLLDKNKETSITNILDTIFKSNNSIDKLVRIFGTMYVTGHTFNCFGKLLFGKEDFRAKVDEYFICRFPIDRQMLELIGKNIRINIEDYTDSIGEFIGDSNIVDVSEDYDHDTSQK
jgi:hypothetical protein